MHVSESSDSAWMDVIHHRFNVSNTKFEKLLKNPSNRDIDNLQFGYAITLLNRQPRIKVNIEKAGSLLLCLYEKQPEKDLGIASLYYMARIAQVHQTPFNWKEAAQIYEILIKDHPDHFFGQLGLSKYVTTLLYDEVSKKEREERFDRLNNLSTILTIAPIKAHFHYHMGEAAMRLDLSRRKAMDHLLLAVEVDAGIVNWRARVDAYVMIAELARVEGLNKLASKFYNKVLTEFPIDARNGLINDRLRSVEE